MIFKSSFSAEPDLLRAMSVYGGFNVTFVPIREYNPIWRIPTQHACDVAVGGISRTAEREADGITFTNPHWVHSMPQSLLTLKASYDRGFREYKDLRPGMKLGVVHGTTGEPDLFSIGLCSRSASQSEASSLVVTVSLSLSL